MIKKDSLSNWSIVIGVSSCLLGENVRYDGLQKRDKYICDTLSRYFDFLPICPEVGAGMGVPREPVQLTGDPDCPRMIGIKSGKDCTSKVLSFSRKRILENDFSNLSGFIFKKNSPSCGVKDVCLVNDQGEMRRKGIGVFARAVMERYPLMPIEDEERLNNNQVRKDFMDRVLEFHRLNT